VPREAVIDTGTRQIVFVTRDRRHFEPRRVTLGTTGADGAVQVLAGLAPGDTVVTSGQFLLDAESRLREAIEKHLRERLAIPGDTHAGPPGEAHPAPAEDNPLPPADTPSHAHPAQ
jgi:Cu(I)/Ag(I) efflux system membrane fusion protein/cobalt-zinc-cadmium efflux system membrane fusion protein